MTESKIPKTVDNLVDLLRWRAIDMPSENGYWFLENGEGQGEHLSFSQLDRRARAIAAKIGQQANPGDRAILLYPPSLQYIEAFFGCLYAGVIAVPAYPPNPHRLQQTLPRLVSIVEDSEPALALSTGSIVAMASGLADMAPALGGLPWLATDELDDGLADQWEAVDVEADRVAFLQYTSGSTGAPKGVILDHRTLMRNEEIVKQGFGTTSSTVGVHWLPMYHDMGLLGTVIQPVYSGCKSVLMSPLDFLKRPSRWVEAMDRFQGTASAAPNFGYDLAVRKTSEDLRDRLDLSSWQVAINAAEPIRMATLERFAEYFGPCGFDRRAFIPAYGLAEVGVLVSAVPQQIMPKKVEVEEREQVCCGLPLGDFDVQIVDPETRQVLGDDEVGEIWLRKGSVAPGYWEKEEVTAEVFGASLDSGEGPFLRTGDLGLLVDGEIVITGRLKDLIIIRGVNHYPQDIEVTVEAVSPAIRAGCGAAFSVPTDKGEEGLVVVQEVKLDEVDDGAELAERIRQQIIEAHEVVPHAVVLIEPRSINKTSSGKIQRSATRQAYERGELKMLVHNKRQAVAEQAPAMAGDGMSSADGEGDESTAEIESWLVSKVADAGGIEEGTVELGAPFSSYGIDSAQAVGLVGELEQWLDVEIAATALYDFPTIAALASHLGDSDLGEEPSSRPVITEMGGQKVERFALVGMASRLPGADDVEAYWELLQSGEEAIGEVPSWRWKPGTFTDPERAGFDTMVTDRGGFIDGIREFDAAFFGVSPGEARAMDPQQRLIMETSWRAIEDCGWTREHITKSRTGVFIAQSGSDFARLYQGPPVRAGSGMAPNMSANRLSYWLDLRGPSAVIDTACSSSLVALDQALMNLRARRCDAAIVGGVNVILAPDMSVAFSQAQMLSPQGRCFSFDERADGYVRGEGCGVVVVKRLDDALRDGDRIRAVIRGSAVNQDGRTNGLTAPSGRAQQDVIEAALADAGIEAGSIGAVEAHGTGTELGDAIEVRALRSVFNRDRIGDGSIFLGSVKAQIGHLEAAAGMAGLVKATLLLEHGAVAAQVNFANPNPTCELQDSVFTVPRQMQDWPEERRGQNIPRRIGVSSYGFGGTNAHVIVEQPPETADIEVIHRSFERKRYWPKAHELRQLMAGE